MSSISSQSVDAIIAKLEEASGRPSGLQAITRCNLSKLSKDDAVPAKKWAFAMLGPDVMEPIDTNGNSKQHATTVWIDIYAFGDATTPADVAADTIANWCTKKLDGAALTGLAERVEETKREPKYSQPGDYPCCELRLTYLVHHTSRIGDAELRY